MFAGRESPWQTLGLESGTAVLRDVKRAYAALLKKHRPETDPEGFRRVHDAYEAVLHELKLRDQPAEAVPEFIPDPLPRAAASPAAGPAAPAEAPLPAPFHAAMEKLRAARDAGTEEGVADALLQLRLVCGGDAELWRAWGRMLQEIFPAGIYGTPAGRLLTLADILAELRAGSDDIATQMLEGWYRERKTALLVSAGRALTATGAAREFDHPACGRFALRLAFVLGVAQPGGANQLLDAAFRWLPPLQRSQLMPPVENRLHNARVFWHVPATWRPFWEQVLDALDHGTKYDWDTPEARRAVRDLLRFTPADWPGWSFLESQLPPRDWQGVLTWFNSRPRSHRLWQLPPVKEWLDERPESAPGNSPGLFKKAFADDWEIPEAKVVPQGTAPVPGANPPAAAAGSTAAPAERRRTRVQRRRDYEVPDRPRGLPAWWRRLGTQAKIAILGVFLPMVVLTILVYMANKNQQMSAPPGSTVDYAAMALARIDEISAQFPAAKVKLDLLLNSNPAEQKRRIGETPLQVDQSRTGEHVAIVFAVLHPRVGLDVKLRAIDRLKQVQPAAEAVNLLKAASIPGSGIANELQLAFVEIGRDRGHELPESMRQELLKLEQDQKARRPGW